jgi:hypothetical protein
MSSCFCFFSYFLSFSQSVFQFPPLTSDMFEALIEDRVEGKSKEADDVGGGGCW